MSITAQAKRRRSQASVKHRLARRFAAKGKAQVKVKKSGST